MPYQPSRLQATWLALVILFVVSLSAVVNAESWEGYRKVEFEIAGRAAFLIVPHEVAAGKPWIWRTEFFGHEPQADLSLLKHGFHVAYVDIQNLYGAPRAMAAMDAMYAHVTAEFDLSKKTVLEGFSRGGLYSLNWGANNPDKVACIVNDAPVCDISSWPGGKGKGPGSPADWLRCLDAYGLTEEEALTSPLNPINNLKPLAAAMIPLLHVCGAADEVVPMEENSLLVQQKYVDLGGPFVLIAKPHCKHHPHSLRDPTRIVNFVLTHTGFQDRTTPPLTPFGYDYFALRSGLDNCHDSFTQKKVGRVAFLGGSITAGPGWRDLVCEELTRRFPNTQFDFINAGIPSLGSTPGAYRFERDVLANGPVDLLFAEAAVNDDTNGFSDVEQLRGMEGIVRQAYLSNPSIDIVLLHFVDPGKMTELRAGKTPAVIENHERVAEHYGVPSINLAKEVTERIDAGEFSWEADFRDLHPSPFGHALYAKSIDRLLSAAWDSRGESQRTSVATNESPESKASNRRELPQPLDPFSYFGGVLINPMPAVQTKAVALGQGWILDEDWRPSDQAGTRPGFVDVPALVAESPGATLSFHFNGVGVGVFVASGPDTGTLEYRVDNGQWEECELFTQWSAGLHLPWAKMLASELIAGEHLLELRVAESADARSQGHAVRIVHFLVNRNPKR